MNNDVMLKKLRAIADSLLDLVMALEESVPQPKPVEPPPPAPQPAPQPNVADLMAQCTALMAQNGWTKDDAREYVRRVYKKKAVDLSAQEWQELNTFISLHTPDMKKVQCAETV